MVAPSELKQRKVNTHTHDHEHGAQTHRTPTRQRSNSNSRSNSSSGMRRSASTPSLGSPVAAAKELLPVAPAATTARQVKALQLRRARKNSDASVRGLRSHSPAPQLRSTFLSSTSSTSPTEEARRRRRSSLRETVSDMETERNDHSAQHGDRQQHQRQRVRQLRGKAAWRRRYPTLFAFNGVFGTPDSRRPQRGRLAVADRLSRSASADGLPAFETPATSERETTSSSDDETEVRQGAVVAATTAATTPAVPVLTAGAQPQPSVVRRRLWDSFFDHRHRRTADRPQETDSDDSSGPMDFNDLKYGLLFS